MPNMTDPKIFENVSVPMRYTAIYEKRDFTVTWKNWDASTLKTEVVGMHMPATPPPTPTREDYTFTGWSPNTYSRVTSNLEISAQFKEIIKEKFIVTWKDWNGSVLKTETVVVDSPATPPASPTRDGYDFTGWLPSTYSSVTSNLEITAQFKEKTFTVIWKNWDDSTLKTEEVGFNKAATPPLDPTKDCANFTGWAPDTYSNITSDLEIVAQFIDISSFNVKWMYGQEVIKEEVVDRGGIANKPLDEEIVPKVPNDELFYRWDYDNVGIMGDTIIRPIIVKKIVYRNFWEDTAAIPLAQRRWLNDGYEGYKFGAYTTEEQTITLYTNILKTDVGTIYHEYDIGDNFLYNNGDGIYRSIDSLGGILPIVEIDDDSVVGYTEDQVKYSFRIIPKKEGKTRVKLIKPFKLESGETVSTYCYITFNVINTQLQLVATDNSWEVHSGTAEGYDRYREGNSYSLNGINAYFPEAWIYSNGNSNGAYIALYHPCFRNEAQLNRNHNCVTENSACMKLLKHDDCEEISILSGDELIQYKTSTGLIHYSVYLGTNGTINLQIKVKGSLFIDEAPRTFTASFAVKNSKYSHPILI